MSLPFRRAYVASFWILTTATVSVVIGLTSRALGASTFWPAAGGLLLPLPALLWPRWLEIGIRVWNKSARRIADALRAYALKVSYYVLFGPVGMTGSALRLELGPRETSRWIQHRAGSSGSDRGDADSHSLFAFARQPGNAWAVCLFPVLALLSFLRDDSKDGAPPPNTYTLY